MIRLCGLRPGADIEIQVTGMRPGEKLQESLVGPGEALDDDHDGAILGIETRQLTTAVLGDAVVRLAAMAEQIDSVRAGKALLEAAAPAEAVTPALDRPAITD
jgi:FlaA1/EpsC-like NDP-sugar epimerase